MSKLNNIIKGLNRRIEYLDKMYQKKLDEGFSDKNLGAIKAERWTLIEARKIVEQKHLENKNDNSN